MFVFNEEPNRRDVAVGVVPNRIDEGDVEQMAIGLVIETVDRSRPVAPRPRRVGKFDIGRTGPVVGVVADEDCGITVGCVDSAIAEDAADLHVERREDLRSAVQHVLDVPIGAGKHLDVLCRVALEIQVQHGWAGVAGKLLGQYGHVGDHRDRHQLPRFQRLES
jgi:hypothetical protein